jgi:hypothetical protein
MTVMPSQPKFVEYVATCPTDGCGMPAVWYGVEHSTGTKYDRVDCPRCMSEEGEAA